MFNAGAIKYDQTGLVVVVEDHNERLSIAAEIQSKQKGPPSGPDIINSSSLQVNNGESSLPQAFDDHERQRFERRSYER